MNDFVMNERLKFSWGHIIAFVALIAVSYTTFVGFTYLTNGSFVAGAVGMGMTDIVFIVVFIGAQQLKASGIKMKKKLVWERILVFGSPFVFIVGMIAMSHFWTVRSLNDEVVEDFNNSLVNGKAIFNDYEKYANARIDNYSKSLDKIIASRQTSPALYKKAGFTPGIEQAQKDNMVEVLRLQLLSSNYDSLKNLALTWIEKANSGASTYNVFLLGNTREIQDALINWEGQLKGFSTKKLSNEQLLAPVKDFDTNAGSAAARQIGDLGQKFTSQKIPTLTAIFFGVAVYLMMIFPYFLQDRHSKSVYSLIGGSKKKKEKAVNEVASEDFDNTEDSGTIEHKYREDDEFPSF